jgi:hypothetical protein
MLHLEAVAGGTIPADVDSDRRDAGNASLCSLQADQDSQTTVAKGDSKETCASYVPPPVGFCSISIL